LLGVTVAVTNKFGIRMLTFALENWSSLPWTNTIGYASKVRKSMMIKRKFNFSVLSLAWYVDEINIMTSCRYLFSILDFFIQSSRRIVAVSGKRGVPGIHK